MRDGAPQVDGASDSVGPEYRHPGPLQCRQVGFHNSPYHLEIDVEVGVDK